MGEPVRASHRLNGRGAQGEGGGDSPPPPPPGGYRGGSESVLPAGRQSLRQPQPVACRVQRFTCGPSVLETASACGIETLHWERLQKLRACCELRHRVITSRMMLGDIDEGSEVCQTVEGSEVCQAVHPQNVDHPPSLREQGGQGSAPNSGQRDSITPVSAGTSQDADFADDVFVSTGASVCSDGLLTQEREDVVEWVAYLEKMGCDGLLSQEREDVVDRVAYLEKKVTVQEDEIVCLKSALADVIRRLATLESAANTQNSFLPSKPTFRTPNPRRSAPTRRSTALDNINMAGSSARSGGSHSSLRSPRSATSSHSASSASSQQQQLKKWASLSNSTEMSNSQLTPNK
ncbi:hypothetical protein ACOMHN_009110 [Nucella lapillus]